MSSKSRFNGVGSLNKYLILYKQEQNLLKTCGKLKCLGPLLVQK